MTKKDYIQFAKKFEGLKPVQSDLETLDEYMARREEWKIMIWAVSDIFQQDNPRFDPDKFLKACGIGEN